MNGTDPSNDGTLQMIERTAQRWASARFSNLPTAEAASKAAFHDSIFDEMRGQGWFPACAEDLEQWSALTVAHLGKGLGRDGAGAFLLVLTHLAALKLLGASRPVEFPEGLLATSPFWNFMRVPPPLCIIERDGARLLNGKLPMVVHPSVSSHFVVVAKDSDDEPAIVVVDAKAKGLALHEPQGTLGLWGPTVRAVVFDSVAIQDIAAQAHVAREAQETSIHFIEWGAVGLLAGIVERALEAATEYAELRYQGGQRISEHRAVAELLSSAESARRCFELWLSTPYGRNNTVPLKEARLAALQATDAALQVFGGLGYVFPGVAERCWRDARQAAALCSDRPYFA